MYIIIIRSITYLSICFAVVAAATEDKLQRVFDVKSSAEWQEYFISGFALQIAAVPLEAGKRYALSGEIAWSRDSNAPPVTSEQYVTLDVFGDGEYNPPAADINLRLAELARGSVGFSRDIRLYPYCATTSFYVRIVAPTNVDGEFSLESLMLAELPPDRVSYMFSEFFHGWPAWQAVLPTIALFVVFWLTGYPIARWLFGVAGASAAAAVGITMLSVVGMLSAIGVPTNVIGVLALILLGVSWIIYSVRIMCAPARCAVRPLVQAVALAACAIAMGTAPLRMIGRSTTYTIGNGDPYYYAVAASLLHDRATSQRRTVSYDGSNPWIPTITYAHWRGTSTLLACVSLPWRDAAGTLISPLMLAAFAAMVLAGCACVTFVLQKCSPLAVVASLPLLFGTAILHYMHNGYVGQAVALPIALVLYLSVLSACHENASWWRMALPFVVAAALCWVYAAVVFVAAVLVFGGLIVIILRRIRYAGPILAGLCALALFMGAVAPAFLDTLAKRFVSASFSGLNVRASWAEMIGVLPVVDQRVHAYVNSEIVQVTTIIVLIIAVLMPLAAIIRTRHATIRAAAVCSLLLSAGVLWLWRLGTLYPYACAKASSFALVIAPSMLIICALSWRWFRVAAVICLLTWLAVLMPSVAVLTDYVCVKNANEKFYIRTDHESLTNAVSAAGGRVIGLSSDIDRVWDYVWCLYYLRRAPMSAPRAITINWLGVPATPPPPHAQCMLHTTASAADVLWSNATYSLSTVSE